MHTNSPVRRGTSRTSIVAILALLAVVAVVALYVYVNSHGSGGNPSEPALMQATCASLSGAASSVEHVASGGTGDTAYFLIVAADPPSPYAGFNGSYYLPTTDQLPTMNVRQGQTVSIHVINCASGESHGFAVSYYDENSNVSIQPGHSYDVTFTATKTGSFRVYCDIFCAIHPFMQNGALIVS